MKDGCAEMRQCAELTQAEAAELFKVSRRNVQRARYILETADDCLAEAIRNGALSVNAAHSAARELSHNDQRKACMEPVPARAIERLIREQRARASERARPAADLAASPRRMRFVGRSLNGDGSEYGKGGAE